MNTFLKLVSGIAVGVVVLSVLYGILHILLSFAVAGVFLIVFGVVCLLAVVGLIALVRGLIGKSLPAEKQLHRKSVLTKRVAGKAVEQKLRELESKLGPRQ